MDSLSAITTETKLLHKVVCLMVVLVSDARFKQGRNSVDTT